MKYFRRRLHLAYLVLTHRYFLVFVPTGPDKATVGEGAAMSANAWASLALYAGLRAEQARAEAEALLLADMAAEKVRVAEIEAEISAILNSSLK